MNSVDCLLKPIEPDALERAINKVEALRESSHTAAPDFKLLLRQIEDSVRQARSNYPERIASSLGDRIWFLVLSEVTHFYAEDKLTYAVSEGKSYCVDHTVSELEQKLDPRKFFRIHRGTIVNSEWIKEVSALPGGMLNVRLKDAKSTDLTVSRGRAREFKTHIGC